MGIVDSIQELTGGGTMGLWAIGAVLVALWIAWKILKGTIKLVVLGAAALTVLGLAPWSTSLDDNPAAGCAREVAADSMSGWQTFIAKRITIDDVSSGSACNADGDGLVSGGTTATLRTLFDIPIATFEIDPQGAEEVPTE